MSDKKFGTPVTGIPSQIAYYTADVKSAQDYYPFGMEMPGRTYSNLPRYTFNGKEYDPETGYQDYGMRMYDGGRFISPDPLTKKYPGLTPYQFASNSPILGIDKDGKEFAMNKWLFDIWLEWEFGDPTGAKTLTSGIEQKVAIQNQQTSYNNANVPKPVQTQLNQINSLQANAKIAAGTSQVIAFNIKTSFDIISSVAPIGEGILRWVDLSGQCSLLG